MWLLATALFWPNRANPAIDPDWTLAKVAEERQKNWMPEISVKFVLQCYVDWRANNCTGFTESLKGKNHNFTILLDAHPDLEQECRDCLTIKTKDEKCRLTVTKFCDALNSVLMPGHDGLDSALVDPKDNTTPFITFMSHTVAWRFMVHLGAKHGALQKGLVQDHERHDVVVVRKKFVSTWTAYMPRMFVHRRLNVEAPKKHMQPIEEHETTAFKGNEEQFVKGLNLFKIKEEAPTDKELAAAKSWAEGHSTASARSALDDATEDTVVVEADKLDHVGRAGTEVMGPLQTKARVAFEWEGGIFKLISATTGDLHAVVDEEDRPIIVWMHDECMFRHKDIGRYGWSFRKMASQRFKDDGSGRM